MLAWIVDWWSLLLQTMLLHSLMLLVRLETSALKSTRQNVLEYVV
jgi:hypothetical protein